METAVINAGSGRAPAVRTAAHWARALGWFSVGLGVASLIMPRRLARSAGVVHADHWLRAIGAREVIAGAGILLRPDQPGWLWSRVAGDAMDLALLALAARNRHSATSRRLGMVSAALTGMTVLDLLVAWDHSARLHGLPSAAGEASASVSQVKKSLDVNRSPEECYRFWRDLVNFPRFMPHVEQVSSTDATHSR